MTMKNWETMKKEKIEIVEKIQLKENINKNVIKKR
jgi:hypothetical protein